MILGRHGDAALPDAGKGRALIEEAGVLGVDVEDVQPAGASGELCFDEAQQATHGRGFKGVEEEEDGGRLRQGCLQGIAFYEADGSEWVRVAAGDSKI